MEIYIEYAIIDNLVFDAVICLLALYCCRKKIRWWRVLASCVFGTAFAVCLPLIALSPFITVPLKILSGCFMVFFLYPFKKISEYFRCLLAFMLATLVIGGACFGLIFIAEKDFSRALNLSYTAKSMPVGLIVFALVSTVLLVVRFALWIQRAKISSGFTYKIKVFALGRAAEINAFLDSGNKLFDPLTNFPVVVVNMEALRRLFDAQIIDGLFSGRDIGLRLRMMDFQTVGSGGKLMMFAPEKLVIYSEGKPNTLYDVMIGISYKAFGAGEYEALLHPALVR